MIPRLPPVYGPLKRELPRGPVDSVSGSKKTLNAKTKLGPTGLQTALRLAAGPESADPAAPQSSRHSQHNAEAKYFPQGNSSLRKTR